MFKIRPHSNELAQLKHARNSALSVIVVTLALLASMDVLASGTILVTHLSGTLIAKVPDGGSRVLSVKSEVREGETLVTQANTYARIKFDGGEEVVLRPNSQLAVTRYSYRASEPDKDSFTVGLLKGGLRMVTGLLGKRNPNRVEVTTSTATIGIRGTHFGLLMCQGDCADIPTVTGMPPADGLHADVADGAISVTNPAGQQVIGTGQFGYVHNKNTPPTLVPPNRGIQVTMPTNISQNAADGRSVGPSHQTSECTVQ